MTREQHAIIGIILGFPACCVEAWVADNDNAAIRRGAIHVRGRSPIEARILSDALGLPLDGVQSMQYVPCENCIGQSGWFDWGLTFSKPDNEGP